MPSLLIRLALVLPLLLAACAPPTSPPPAPTDQAELADFYGYWQGATTPDADQNRAAFVLIEETPEGFRVTWRNISAPEDGGGIVQRESELRFAPSGVPNRWVALMPESDVDVGAAILGDVLTVRIAGPTEDGLIEEQVYDRRVVDNVLTLDYRRLVGGEVRRELQAVYRRTDI